MTKSSHEDHDTTISDIHRARQRLAEESGGDLRKISEAARKRQEKSGRPTVSFATEDPQKPTATNP